MNGDTSEMQHGESKAFAARLGLPFRDSIDGLTPDASFVERYPISLARKFGVLVLRDEFEQRWLIFANQGGWARLDSIRRLLATPLHGVVVDESVLQPAIDDAYSKTQSGSQKVLADMRQDQSAEAMLQQLAIQSDREDLLEVEGRAPIIRLVNQILFEAVQAGASDVHIQPFEDRVVVRQRVDGVLFDVFEIPKQIQEAVLTRIKVMGKMNVAEKRLPQDGRAAVVLGKREVDLRIASLPTSHNERIVVRLLDKSARHYSLNELGMDDAMLEVVQKLINRDHGLILVTGPTGSGKSTTLYGALKEVNSKELNVLTLENPIEYQLTGISQTQINEKKGMTFASGMRSVLRQDPDVIMVGEIRDPDTANMAIQASLTGHLVFSTLHTNDAASAATRLLDLRVEPYLVASSLVAVLAQRLVRRLCPACKISAADMETASPISDAPEAGFHRPLMPVSRQDVGHNPQDPFRPGGCEACRQTGFRGRLGIFELMLMTDAIRQLVNDRASAAEIRKQAKANGLIPLTLNGYDKVARGLTTSDEVLRVASDEI